MSFRHICKTMRTCKAVHSPTKNHVLKLLVDVMELPKDEKAERA